MEEQEKKEKRIPNITGLGMLSMAGLYDLIGLIPAMSIILMPFVWLHFWLWFAVHRVNLGFGSPKRLITMALGGLIEIIPGLGEVAPTWILAIGIQLFFVRFEDMTGISLKKSPGELKRVTSGRTGQKLLRRAQTGPRKDQLREEKRQALQQQRGVVQRAQRMQDVRQQQKGDVQPQTS